MWYNKLWVACLWDVKASWRGSKAEVTEGKVIVGMPSLASRQGTVVWTRQ